MRRLVLATAFAAFSLISSAGAEINFGGIKWLSKPSQVIKIMADKGYGLKDVSEDHGASDYIFSGTIATAEAEFVFRFDLEDDLVQVTVVTEELGNPAQLYQSLVKSISSKYGDATDGEDKRSPQFENITSHTQLSQGIRLGEVYWTDSWEDDSDELRIETLKGGYVRLDYYSPYWSDEYDRRQEGKTDDL